MTYATRWVRAGAVAATLGVLGWLGGCSDHPSDPGDQPLPQGLILSDPASAPEAASVAAAGASLTSSVGDEVTYVSLPPGTVPNGSTATIRRVGGIASFATTLFEGGFDPVPVGAQVGDSIEVVVRDNGDATVGVFGLSVKASRPPIVVRTQPPRRKTDVPVNAAVVVVFSEPVAGATVTSGSVRLLRGQTVVSGTVRFLDASLDASHVSIEFVPDAPLDANTQYQLVVTQQVRDLDSEALLAVETVTFTTGQASVGPPAVLTLSIDSIVGMDAGTSRQLTATVRDAAGNQLTDQPVTWSSSDAAVATVSSTGLVHAVASGLALVNASAGSANDHLWVGVSGGPPPSVTIAPANDTIGVGGYVVLTPEVRDSLGRDMANTIRSICWSSSNTLVAKFGGAQGSACLDRPDYVIGWGIGVYGIDTGTVTITARVTVRPSIVLPVDTEVTGTTSVFVGGQPGVASVTLSPDSLTTVPSASFLLGVAVRARDGRRLHDRPIEWASDAPNVAVVDSTVIYPPTGELVGGAVTALGPGVATISATSEGVTASARLEVVTPAFSAVSAGDDYTCGVATGGAALCWRSESSPKLGWGLPVVFYRPAPARTGGLTFSAVSAGLNHACAVTSDARGKCWGTWPVDITGMTNTFWSPQDIAPSPDGVLSLAEISRGQGHTCGLTISKAAYCWGDNSVGQLGRSDVAMSLRPLAVSGGLGFESVTAGGAHTCAVATGGGADCWGSNSFGQLGNGLIEHSRFSPTAVTGGLEFTTITTGLRHTCGVTTTGAVYCWGRNDRGQLGDSTTTDRPSPVAVGNGRLFATLSAGVNHTCGVTDTGAAYCWGWNGNGQLGDGTTTSSTSPVPVAGGLTFTSVSAGYSHTCGITTTGILYCWGYNETGALGDGTTVDRTTPVKVLGQP